MTGQLLPPRLIDSRLASERDYRLLNVLDNRLRAEWLPDDPPIPLDEYIQNWRNTPPFIDIPRWIIVSADGASAVASGSVSVLRTSENAHLAWFAIGVLPEYRQQGLARHLLTLIADTTQREGRRLLLTSTNEGDPAGEIFMSRLGAEIGQQGHINQLALADLDYGLLDRWLTGGAARAANFEVGFWDATYPEEELPAIATLHDLLNQSPRDGLDMEDQHITPEQLRQMERSNRASNTARWTLFARERVTGALAGFTEVFWHPNRPALLSQGITGVFPAYRNQGLGRWLKAAMLDKVLHERPQVRAIRTGNADSNAAMLAINHQLGFKPYIANTIWQVDLGAIRRYLAE